MRTNLSSQIRLERTPLRYYRPETAYDHSVIARNEKLYTDIYESEEEGASVVADEIAALIRSKAAIGKKCVLGLSGGFSPRKVYDFLVAKHRKEGLSFENVVVFNVSEYYPLPSDAPHTNIKMLKDMLLDHVDVKQENIFSPDPSMPKDSIFEFCKQYEAQIALFGGLDYVLLGIGLLGNIGYNEPGSHISSQARLMLLDSESRKSIARFYNSTATVPTSAITMGIDTILKADKAVLVAFGESKSPVVVKAVEGDNVQEIPAAYLQLHRNAKAVVDLAAADELTRISHPWLVTSCEWTDKMIRRAIVWLCLKINKPILKLTDKDYNENGLSELLALYGSAYNVNIKIFNALQHTITGWPGGKPNADDTNRPERAKPYPKRIIVFSPHPDDDVISMGGTFKRLVDQKHEVYVAYETSGNIAVGDEEVIRYISLMENANERYSPENSVLKKKCEEVLNFLFNEKKEGDVDSADVRFLKGYIRREEAKSACRYVGVPVDRVNFLDLPFYETGKIKKGDLSQADIDIVKALLQRIQPHQMFVAGDLADPHGTHKVCLDAVLAAIDELKEEAWMKECRIWMYRGAWAEWEIDHIEMAVPISPEELRSKRNSILRHQSQMESAPFLGNDDRLFWQRAEERNRATADLYTQLGLASYEAIEAFVEYVPL